MSQNYRKDILEEIVGSYPEDVSVGELIKQTGYARATIIRYLSKLEQQGFVEQNRKVGKARMYTIGPKIQNLLKGNGTGDTVNDLLRVASTE